MQTQPATRTYPSILGLDCSGQPAQFGLLHQGQARLEAHDLRSARLSASMPKLLDQLLQGIPASTLDAVAVITGPGSFTGLRLALSFARAFDCAFKARIYAWSRFEVMAYQMLALAHTAGARILIIALSLKDEVYLQPFQARSNTMWKAIAKPELVNKDNLDHVTARFEKTEHPLMLAGDGAERLQAWLDQPSQIEEAHITMAFTSLLHAASACWLKDAPPENPLEPCYVRMPYCKPAPSRQTVQTGRLR